MTNGQMVMAGLWEKWKHPKPGSEVLSCTVLTCPSNNAVAELHYRKPVILAESDWAKWLGEVPANENELLNLLKPFAAERMTMWKVGKAVGSVRNQGANLIEPAKS